MSEDNSDDKESLAQNNEDQVKSKLTKRRLIIICAGVIIICSCVGASLVYMMKSNHTAVSTISHDQPATYIDVNPMVVNLHSSDGQTRFLKIHFFIVPASAAKGDSIKARLPLIVDAYQPFLRELRPEDLAGSAAVFRIKEELLVRANAIVGTGMVKDILIQDLLQQ